MYEREEDGVAGGRVAVRVAAAAKNEAQGIGCLMPFRCAGAWDGG